MGILWSRSHSDDYERILSDLTTRIAELESLVADTRHRSRRWSLFIISYGTLLYVLHAIYVFLYPRGPPTVAYRPLLDAVGLVMEPVFVIYARRLVEELKKATSYYKTKGLVERFEIASDEGAPMNSEPMQPAPKPTVETTEQQPLSPPPASPPPPPPAAAPTPLTWLDRLVDAIIGDDRSTRYALICPRCFSHNGLARPEEFEILRTHNIPTHLKELGNVASKASSSESIANEPISNEPISNGSTSNGSISNGSASNESAPKQDIPNEAAQVTPKQPSRTVRRRGRRKSPSPSPKSSAALSDSDQ
ncbi:hypothetical protein PSACC_01671 [Paramicrosporidium saccamoebae]|uniref:Endoplasmic reticulum junction formation protein lunapark n=1 Tax=Paramicrosporidium saccamoebae TaxID=1246581 RepID=A0A2H9TL64_9FUNG|nr:hypothetical protein PSACC_01671 [Paramicrosporidium saccamoebae]